MQAVKTKKGRWILALAVLSVMNFTVGVQANPTVTLSKWLEDIKFSGDLRLRHETFDYRDPGVVDRHRQRYRLRLNADFKFPYKFMVRTAFASGTGEQSSTNQSFDNNASQKGIYIDKAYVVWTPSLFKLQGGRMDNPLWRQYSSDIVWDTDYNPEGFSQGVSTLVGSVQVFANAMQMVVDEDSGANAGVNKKDQWLLAHQLGAEVKLPWQSRFRFAWANYNWRNERNATDFGQASGGAIAQNGNRRVGATNVLNNDFYVNEYTGALSFWVANKPVSLQGTYIRNDQARGDLDPQDNTGYQWGTIVNKAGAKNTWEAAYFRKVSRADATVADVADADFGDGGTNRRGHIVWVAYAPQDWMLFQAKYLHTREINTALSGRDAIRRFQLDWNLKF